MKPSRKHTFKRCAALFLSVAYLVISVCIIFLLPKTNNLPLNQKGKVVSVISDQPHPFIKNFLKRTDKVSSVKRKQLISVHSFVAIFTGLHSLSKIESPGIISWLKHNPSTPPGFGCLINCCRRIWSYFRLFNYHNVARLHS